MKHIPGANKKYHEGKIIMILDNARIHHAKLVQPFFNTHKNSHEDHE